MNIGQSRWPPCENYVLQAPPVKNDPSFWRTCRATVHKPAPARRRGSDVRAVFEYAVSAAVLGGNNNLVNDRTASCRNGDHTPEADSGQTWGDLPFRLRPRFSDNTDRPALDPPHPRAADVAPPSPGTARRRSSPPESPANTCLRPRPRHRRKSRRMSSTGGREP